MRKLGNIVSGLILVLVFLASITFSYFNTTEIGLTFGSFEFAARPISVWIVGGFVTGGLLGLLLGLRIFHQLKTRSELKRLTKELEKSQQEVNKLRSLSLKDLQ